MSPSTRFARLALITLAGALLSNSLRAQTTPTAAEVSGQLFASYQYSRSPDSRAANRFDLDRAYLTVRAPAGDRASVRVTANVFQQRTSGPDAYYRGWTLRAKMAYLQYDLVRPSTSSGIAVNAAVGLIPTVVIEHIQRFWPRWISQAAEERVGYFSSADAGAYATLTLPHSRGEAYATITNGGGYTTRETDRFKDYAARFSWTPLASGRARILQTLTISPWISKGDRASDFVAGRGTVLPVADGRQRDRYGIFTGVRHPRVSAGVDISQSRNVAETADTLAATAPAVRTVKGRMISTFALVHPFRPSSSAAHLGLLARYDLSTPDTDNGADVRFVIAGATWDLTRNVSLALDYQEQERNPYLRSADSKTYMMQFLANF